MYVPVYIPYTQALPILSFWEQLIYKLAHVLHTQINLGVHQHSEFATQPPRVAQLCGGCISTYSPCLHDARLFHIMLKNTYYAIL